MKCTDLVTNGELKMTADGPKNFLQIKLFLFILYE